MIVSVHNIYPAIVAAKTAIGRQKPESILSHVLIQAHDDSITITGGDMQTEISTTVPAAVRLTGSICLPLAPLLAFARTAGASPVMIQSEMDGASLTANGQCSIASRDPDTYPRLETQVSDAEGIRLDATIFGDAIRRVEHCAGRQDVRPYLNGVALFAGGSSLTLVASDGHRMARSTLPIAPADKNACIIPIKTALDIAKVFKKSDISLQIDGGQLRIKNPDTTLTTKTIPGTHPGLRPEFARKQPIEVDVNSREFVAVIESGSVAADTAQKIVRLDFSVKRLVATARSTSGRESMALLACDNHTPFALAFCATHFISAAKKINGQMTVSSDGESHITLSSPDGATTYIIASINTDQRTK